MTRITEITNKGHALLNKVLARKCELVFTKAVAGDGIAADARDVEEMISPKLVGRMVEVTAKPMEHHTIIKTVFSNETVAAYFQFNEIGVFAADPDEGEILYCYGLAGERANFIGEFSGQWYTEDIVDIAVYTATAANVIGNIIRTEWAKELGYDNSKSGLEAGNVQDAIDEMILLHPLITDLEHNLCAYPVVLTLEGHYGAGIGGTGETPGGGTESINIRNNVTYLDKDRIAISVAKRYSAVKSVDKVNDKEYVVTFDGEDTLSLLIVLVTNDCRVSVGGGTVVFPDELEIATDVDVDAMLDRVFG